MERRIEPEPTDAEREAIAAALDAEDEEPDPRGPWWRAGLRDALEGELEPP
jgi:hypothetical protein